jgi:hypothetical protein
MPCWLANGLLPGRGPGAGVLAPGAAGRCGADRSGVEDGSAERCSGAFSAGRCSAAFSGVRSGAFSAGLAAAGPGAGAEVPGRDEAPGLDAGLPAGAGAAGAAFSARPARAERSFLATGGSTVEDAPRTNSPRV